MFVETNIAVVESHFGQAITPPKPLDTSQRGAELAVALAEGRAPLNVEMLRW